MYLECFLKALISVLWLLFRDTQSVKHHYVAEKLLYDLLEQIFRPESLFKNKLTHFSINLQLLRTRKFNAEFTKHYVLSKLNCAQNEDVW